MFPFLAEFEYEPLENTSEADFFFQKPPSVPLFSISLNLYHLYKITQNAIDSATRSLMASQSHKLTITYIPGFQITTPDLPIPRTNNTLQDLTNQLIEQGGGTLIIEQESTTNQAETTATKQISQQDTTTTQNTHYHEKQTQQPRASPILDRLIILIIAATIFIIVLKLVIRHTHTV